MEGECHFPGDDVEPDEDLLNTATVREEESLPEPQEKKEHEEDFHYVAKGVYSSWRDRNNEKAREFLEKIGVCEVDEAERIKAILRQRYADLYTPIPSKLHEEDMKRFIALVENEPDKAALFKNYRIFKTAGGDCSTADRVYLDSPYLETGVNVCYKDDKCDIDLLEEYYCVYFSLAYEEADIDPKRLGKFAEKLGAKTKLETIAQRIPKDRPEWINYLCQGSGRWISTGTNKDYRIPEFQILLGNPSIAKSKLIWQTMCSLPECYLKARCRRNRSQELREGKSSLVHELRNAAWAPQKKANSKTSFVRPCDASIECLCAPLRCIN